MSPDYRGETVDVQDFGRGIIIDQTESLVGIKLDRPGCQVLYVPIADLKPWDEAED